MIGFANINISCHNFDGNSISFYLFRDGSLLSEVCVSVSGSNNLDFEKINYFLEKRKDNDFYTSGKEVDDLPVFHYNLKIDGIVIEQYDVFGTLAIAKSIGRHFSSYSMEHIAKNKKIDITKKNYKFSKKYSKLKEWASLKISNLIKNDLYAFTDICRDKQDFRILKSINRLISCSKSNFFKFNDCFYDSILLLHCDEVFTKELEYNIFNNNAFAYFFPKMTYVEGKFLLGLLGKPKHLSEYFDDNLFLQKLYNDFPHAPGHIGMNFIVSIDKNKDKNISFKGLQIEMIEFKDKPKIFKIFWMMVYLDVLNMSVNSIKFANYCSQHFVNKDQVFSFLKEYAKSNNKNNKKLYWTSNKNISSAISDLQSKLFSSAKSKIKQYADCDILF